jgi:hypothetical protein
MVPVLQEAGLCMCQIFSIYCGICRNTTCSILFLSGEFLFLDTYHVSIMSVLLLSEFWNIFIHRLGDCIEAAPFPLLSKARTVGDENAVLLPLHFDRHFGPSFQLLTQEPSIDYPFWDKVPKVRRDHGNDYNISCGRGIMTMRVCNRQAFWRGATTDSGWDPTICPIENHRRALIEQWAHSNDGRIDVGLSYLVQEANENPVWQRYAGHVYKQSAFMCQSPAK